MAWRAQLEPESHYVLDLIETSDGIRVLRPRLASEPTHPDARFSSQAYVGSDLMLWRNTNKVSENVRLSDGSTFLLDAHGHWLTPSEYELIKRGGHASPPSRK
jgi:hypothetical protein